MTTPPDDADDLVAVGADLEPGTVLAAYRLGLFPMPVEDTIGWWSPYRRGVLTLRDLKVSRSLAQSVRRYEIRIDTAFDEVIAGCADPTRDGGWMDADIEAAYRDLHLLGWAHSVETWHEGVLVGGLYGLAIGGLFAGESMFSRQRDASKAALVGLVDLLSDGEDRLIDTQWLTPHLATLGVSEIDRRDYLARLPRLLDVPLPQRWR
jgi:leucyl/phenylalanyl-tRNA--protein transferase